MLKYFLDTTTQNRTMLMGNFLNVLKLSLGLGLRNQSVQDAVFTLKEQLNHNLISLVVELGTFGVNRFQACSQFRDSWWCLRLSVLRIIC